jgi:hypothetical protein
MRSEQSTEERPVVGHPQMQQFVNDHFAPEAIALLK